MSAVPGRLGLAMLQSEKARNKFERTKSDIRRNVLKELGGGVVFDAFAGSGALYRKVWKDADGYVGCDLDFWKDERLCFVGDNRRVMRTIDLQPFTIFDFDAFGNPWHQVIILMARRVIAPGERIGVVLTDGSGIKMKMGSIPAPLAALTGFRKRAAGVAREQLYLLDLAIRKMCDGMNCTVDRRWQARNKTGSSMFYVGLVLRGIAS